MGCFKTHNYTIQYWHSFIENSFWTFQSRSVPQHKRPEFDFSQGRLKKSIFYSPRSFWHVLHIHILTVLFISCRFSNVGLTYPLRLPTYKQTAVLRMKIHWNQAYTKDFLIFVTLKIQKTVLKIYKEVAGFVLF